MVESETVFQKLQAACIGGVKVPHLTSLPVVSHLNGKYELAIFVALFTAEKLWLC